jgi:hypothetical protein
VAEPLDIVLRLDEIKTKTTPPINDAFKELRIGDRIKVGWKVERGIGKESYKTDGVIVQLSRSSIYYRCAAGYMCCVSANQMASGIQVEIVKKGKRAA